MKKFRNVVLLLSSTILITACGNNNKESTDNNDTTIESIDDRKIQLEKNTDNIDKNSSEKKEANTEESESTNEETTNNDLDKNSSEKKEANTETSESTNKKTTNNNDANEYGLSGEKLNKFNDIVSNNKNTNIDLEALAYNIANEDRFTEQVMYPGKPYSEQAEVLIDNDVVYTKANDFYPYLAVSNRETLPYGTEIRLAEKLKSIGNNKYRGKVKIQFTDGSNVIKDFTITLDKNMYNKAPKVFENSGDNVLTQRYETNESINKKLKKASEYTDLNKYEKEMRTPDTKKVDEKSASENLALVVGVDIKDLRQYAVAKREGGYYLVQLLSKNGDQYEGLVNIETGQILNFDNKADNSIKFD